jgi:hypothetical protein
MQPLKGKMVERLVFLSEVYQAIDGPDSADLLCCVSSGSDVARA